MLLLLTFFYRLFTELSGTDLIMADLKALEAYILYYYYLSKMWTKPLPEVYNAQEADIYFKCRPHIVALRLIEVDYYPWFHIIAIYADNVLVFTWTIVHSLFPF